MLQKLYTRREGFTLVEIMIVVAIIALLAAFAIPSFMHSRLRSQATACKQDLMMIDTATEQWAVENNKKNGVDTPLPADLKAYIKENSPLYASLVAGTAKDTIGSAITIPVLGTRLTVPTATVTACASVTGTDNVFWSPYNP